MIINPRVGFPQTKVDHNTRILHSCMIMETISVKIKWIVNIIDL